MKKKMEFNNKKLPFELSYYYLLFMVFIIIYYND